MCFFACACRVWGGQRRILDALSLELQAGMSCLIWVLVTEPGFSGRATNVLNWWAIYPAPHSHSNFIFMFSFYIESSLLFGELQSQSLFIIPDTLEIFLYRNIILRKRALICTSMKVLESSGTNHSLVCMLSITLTGFSPEGLSGGSVSTLQKAWGQSHTWLKEPLQGRPWALGFVSNTPNHSYLGSKHRLETAIQLTPLTQAPHALGQVYS